MKILFSKEGKELHLVNKEKLIFKVDDCLINEYGDIVQIEDLHTRVVDTNDDEQWYEHWMEYEGIDKPLKAKSIVEPL